MAQSGCYFSYRLFHFHLRFCSSQKLNKTNQKSSKELYREAAQMLGMSCEFTENCRCLDCQVTIETQIFKPDELYSRISMIFFRTRRAATLTVMMTMIQTRFQIYQESSKRRNFLHALMMLTLFIIVTVTMSFAATEMGHVETHWTINKSWYELCMKYCFSFTTRWRQHNLTYHDAFLSPLHNLLQSFLTV